MMNTCTNGLSCSLTFVVRGMRLFPGNDKSHFVQSHEKGSFLYAYAFCRCAMGEEKIHCTKGDEDVANNQDVDRYTKTIRNIAACERCGSVEEGRQDKG